MWQIFTLGALIFEQAEYVADKVIVVADKALDTFITTFYRNFVFVVLGLLIGATGLIGSLHFMISWPLVIVAALEIISSIFYTLLLKKVELTSSAALSYIAPFLFVFADVFLFRAPLSGLQITGIVLLVCGGITFIVDPLTHHLKPEYTKYILGIFLFELITSAAKNYTFKYYAVAHHLNEISYIVNVWLMVTIGLFIIVIAANRGWALYRTAIHKHYLRKITLSKSFDLTAALLWFHAVKLAAVSQVKALSAFSPLLLLILVYVTQQDLHFPAEENFGRTSLKQKIFATLLLVIGAYLAS